MFNSRMIGITGAALLAMVSGTVNAGTINVPADYADLQAAIDASENGDEILVASGTYTGNFTISGKQVTLTGSGADTILDGGGAGTTLTLEGDDDWGPAVTGFTITGGNGDNGGGVYMSGRSTLSDSTVTYNEAIEGGGAFIVGNAVLAGVRFENNSASSGGGGAAFSLDSTAAVVGCVFKGNSADLGGAAYIAPTAFFESFPIFVGTAFEENTARQGGAIFAMLAGLDLSDVVFASNAADENGGAVWMRDLTITLLDAINARENRASGLGGSFYVDGQGDLEMTASDLVDNAASDGSAGIHIASDASLAVGGSRVYDNHPANIVGDFTDLGDNQFDSGPMCVADRAVPYGQLDIEDVIAYVSVFASNSDDADVAAPWGVVNIDDLMGFLVQYVSGCN